MARVIEHVGPCRFGPTAEHTHFYHIARSIVHQQLSTKAAETIHGRFVALFDTNPVAPGEVAKAPDERLRSAGLSRAKTLYIKELARRLHAGELVLDVIDTMSDEEVIET